MRAIAVNIIIAFATAYILLMVAMAYFQRSLMYFPQPDIPQAAAEKLLPDGQMVHVITEDDLILKSYFIPPRNITKPIILVFHGNASLGIYLSPYFAAMMDNGYGVLFAEYRGYGGNPGEPTEKGLYQDADAYLHYLQDSHPQSKIIAYGQSLGSGPAVDLVSRNPKAFAALILEAPFDSALNVADRTYPYILFKKWILKDQYLSDQKIKKITAPKLFLLAEQDEVVGFQSGMNLFEVAPDPKQIRVYHEATHGTVLNYGASEDIMDFLGTLGQGESH